LFFGNNLPKINVSRDVTTKMFKHKISRIILIEPGRICFFKKFEQFHRLGLSSSIGWEVLTSEVQNHYSALWSFER